MVTEEKKAAVAELNEKFKDAKSMVLTDYIGLDVAEMTELRDKLREKGVEYKVVKNTLAAIAVEKSEVKDEITDYFTGPTAIAFGMEDVISPAKVLVDFEEEHDVFEIKAGYLNEEIIDRDKVLSLSEVPGKEVLLSKTFAGMKAPITGLVNVLQGNLRNLMLVLNQIKEEKA